VEVDPRELITTGNSRNIGDVTLTRPDLVASVYLHGVKTAINASPDPDGRLRVREGFTRVAAAVVAVYQHPTVPVRVVAPGTRLEELVGQGIENFHREGYTRVEEANLYQQIALEGLTDDDIAEQLSRPVDLVTAGRTVAASPRTQAVIDQLAHVDMVTLEVLTEFEEDEHAHAELVDTLTHRPTHFIHAVARLRDLREREALIATEKTRLAELGYTVVDDDEQLPDGAAQLEDLCIVDPTVEPAPLAADDHGDCPGRAVHVDVDYDGQLAVTDICLNYAQHGHRTIAQVAIERGEAQLRDQDVRVIDAELPPTTRELRHLYANSQASSTLNAADHTDCPGHAAYVATGWQPADAVVHYVCVDYADHGHVANRVPVPVHTERDIAHESGERKRAKKNNAAWRVAKPVRREWLAMFFVAWRKRKAATLPARVDQWLALAPILASDYLADAAPGHRFAAELLGLKPAGSYKRADNSIAVLLRRKNTSAAQAMMVRLAQVIGACEQHWDRSYTDGDADATWRRPSEDTQFYFELLAALGYPLSDVEQLVNNPNADAGQWVHLSSQVDDDTETAATEDIAPDHEDEDVDLDQELAALITDSHTDAEEVPADRIDDSDDSANGDEYEVPDAA
jgi:ParB family chromosome partitioning protein